MKSNFSEKGHIFWQFRKESSSETSEIFRVFSKGEVVDVLEGWKLNGTPWIKVQYTGQLRAGYEGEVELEEAPKEDSGWVTGDPSFLFRCK